MVAYEEKPIKLSSDFSVKTQLIRKKWNQIFRLLKKRNYHPETIYPKKIFFRYEGEILTFPDAQKLREIFYFTLSPTL